MRSRPLVNLARKLSPKSAITAAQPTQSLTAGLGTVVVVNGDGTATVRYNGSNVPVHLPAGFVPAPGQGVLVFVLGTQLWGLAPAPDPTVGTGISPDIFTEAGQLLVATAAGTVEVLDIGSADQVLTVGGSDPSGIEWATPSGGGGGAGPLLLASYNGFSDYTVTPGAAVDSTNLTYPFTIPASGNVLARLTFWYNNNGTGAGSSFTVGFSDHTTSAVITALEVEHVASTSTPTQYGRIAVMTYYVEGLTPGAAQWDFYAATEQDYTVGQFGSPFVAEFYPG